ncbi:MAG: YicC/YloC family endoribonuclease [Gemmatimonadota bacterium]
MIRSMTGFGEGELAGSGLRLRAEVRSVNHRHLNTQVRLPRGSEAMEGEVVRWIRGRVLRGHVSVTITREEVEEALDPTLPVLDVHRARRYKELLHELKDSLGLEGKVDLELMSRFRDIFTEPPRNHRESPEAVPLDLLQEVVDMALSGLVAYREREGRALHADLAQRIQRMESALKQIEAAAPDRLIRERDRLREALGALLEGGEVDDERLAREVAHLAERWDIHEEVVRLGSHLVHFQETLAGDGEEAVGKRLGFLVQEMHREINTLGAKANDAGIAREVVGLKEEVEKLREQLENVE